MRRPSCWASSAGRPEKLGPGGVPPVDLLGLAGGGSDVLRGGPDEAPGVLLFHDVGRPAAGARAGEHGGEHVWRDLGEVEHDRGPELDVGLQHPVGAAFSQLGQRRLLQGFGHLVARCGQLLRRTTQNPGAGVFGAVDAVAEALEKAALAELRERRPDRVLETNVEFWAAIVLDFAEVPPHMFTSMFTCARTGGWSAHIMEQKHTGRLIRPSAQYVGPSSRKAEEVDGWDSAWA